MKIDPSGHNIYEIIQFSVKNNDPTLIDKILHFNEYTDLCKDDLERKVFALSYFFFEQFKEDMPIKHLIFNYRISEKNSIDMSVDLNPHIQSMFNSRKLNSELNSTLDGNINNNKSKIKV